MFDRVLVAVDQFDGGRTALDHTVGLARTQRAVVRVLHVITYVGRGCRAPFESPAEASRVVEGAVFTLRMAGVGADGCVRNAPINAVGSRIVEEALEFGADAIVVGARGRRGLSRLAGMGIREDVIRRSPLPVLAAPVVPLDLPVGPAPEAPARNVRPGWRRTRHG